MRYLNLLIALGFFTLALYANNGLSHVILTPANRYAMEIVKYLMFFSAQQSFSWILRELIEVLPQRQIEVRAVLGIIRGLSFLSLMLAGVIPFLSPNRLVMTSIFSSSIFLMCFKVYKAMERYYEEIQMDEGKMITKEMMKQEEIVGEKIQQLLKGEIPEERIRIELQSLDFGQLLDLLNTSTIPRFMQKAKEFRVTAEQGNYFCYISRCLMKEPMFIEENGKIFIDKENLVPDLNHPYRLDEKVKPEDIKENLELKIEIEEFLQDVVNYVAQEMIAIVTQNQEPYENFNNPTSMTLHSLGRRNVTLEGTEQANEASAAAIHQYQPQN